MFGIDMLEPREAQVIAELGDRFQRAGFHIYLVGGTVRDLVSGDVPGDIDLCTDARPEEFEELLRPLGTVYDAGKRFGTLAVSYGEGPDDRIEVTTFRSEGYDPDSRKPDVVFVRDLETDLSRRDFTINAMAIDVMTGELADPFGGREDLERRILRTPSDAVETMSDDPLRAVRAVRFAAVREFEMVSGLVAAIRVTRRRLEVVSQERIMAEVTKMAKTPEAFVRGVEMARYCTIEEAIFGELAAGAERIPTPPEGGAVAGLTSLAVASGLGSAEAQRAVSDLKFPGEVAKAVAVRVQAFKEAAEITEIPEARSLARRFGEEVVREVVARTPERRVAEMIEAVLIEPETFKRIPVDGNDITALGVSGPAVGSILRAVEAAFCANPKLTRDEAMNIVQAQVEVVGA